MTRPFLEELALQNLHSVTFFRGSFVLITSIQGQADILSHEKAT